MHVFFDTTVLVAASVQSHPHHARALPVLRRVALHQDTGHISTHSIAETYATLTRLPLQPRIHPAEAARIIHDNILPNVKLVSVTGKMYLSALETMTRGGWSGAKIYDALLLACAAACPAERVYTFNLGDFLHLAPTELQSKVCAP